MSRITTTPRYASAFWNYQRGGAYDYAELNSVRAEIPAGYFLPSEAEAIFRTHAEKMNVFRRIASVIYTQSSESKIKTVPPFGEAAFVGENGVIPESDVHIVSYTVKPHTIKKICKISKELAADAGFDLPSAIARDFGREFGKAEEDACLTGDGIDRPVGILHAD